MKLINFETITVTAMLVTLVSSNILLGWGPDNVKPGICPESDPDTHCSDSGTYKDYCLHDDHCPKTQKCCFQEDCGHHCVDAIIITKEAKKQTCDAERRSAKPGYCPRPNYNMQCIWCNDNCISDCDCVGKLEKCCPQPGCGNTCRNATDIANGWTAPNCN